MCVKYAKMQLSSLAEGLAAFGFFIPERLVITLEILQTTPLHFPILGLALTDRPPSKILPRWNDLLDSLVYSACSHSLILSLKIEKRFHLNSWAGE